MHEMRFYGTAMTDEQMVAEYESLVAKWGVSQSAYPFVSESADPAAEPLRALAAVPSPVSLLSGSPLLYRWDAWSLGVAGTQNNAVVRDWVSVGGGADDTLIPLAGMARYRFVGGRPCVHSQRAHRFLSQKHHSFPQCFVAVFTDLEDATGVASLVTTARDTTTSMYIPRIRYTADWSSNTVLLQLGMRSPDLSSARNTRAPAAVVVQWLSDFRVQVVSIETSGLCETFDTMQDWGTTVLETHGGINDQSLVIGMDYNLAVHEFRLYEGLYLSGTDLQNIYAEVCQKWNVTPLLEPALEAPPVALGPAPAVAPVTGATGAYYWDAWALSLAQPVMAVTQRVTEWWTVDGSAGVFNASARGSPRLRFVGGRPTVYLSENCGLSSPTGAYSSCIMLYAMACRIDVPSLSENAVHSLLSDPGGNTVSLSVVTRQTGNHSLWFQINGPQGPSAATLPFSAAMFSRPVVLVFQYLSNCTLQVMGTASAGALQTSPYEPEGWPVQTWSDGLLETMTQPRQIVVGTGSARISIHDLRIYPDNYLTQAEMLAIYNEMTTKWNVL